LCCNFWREWQCKSFVPCFNPFFIRSCAATEKQFPHDGRPRSFNPFFIRSCAATF